MSEASPRTGRVARAALASGTLARLGAAQLVNGAQTLLAPANRADALRAAQGWAASCSKGSTSSKARP